MYLQMISTGTLLSAILFMLWCLRGVSRELKRFPSLPVRQVEVDTSDCRRNKPAEVVQIASASKRRPFAAGLGKLAALLVATVLFLGTGLARAEDPDARSTEILQLRELVLKLQSRVEQLEKSQNKTPQTGEPATAQNQAKDVPQSAWETTVTKGDRAALDFFRSTTINMAVDGYYAYNFNRPIGRVNLLRAYDVSSNSFSLNQANIIIERAPEVSDGRRLGARIDLQYGQATETSQGNAANELRPQVYRPLWQAYGTYIFPVGSGIAMDFGKWASALGYEGNYSKDQMNYSRSYLFNFLPFYHMGLRANYNLTSKVNLAYWLVNGSQQTEDFNGFKSQAILFTFKPASGVSWNLNYYFGQEQRDVQPVLNPNVPTVAQPGLPVSNINPVPNGREHIFDTYASWNVTPKLTLSAEGDYVINRAFNQSAPAHVTGAATYVRYQLTPRFALATRGEYLSDRGGLFSGRTQALKENTVTFETKIADGLLVRSEWRRDFSNQPLFPTDSPIRMKKEQNTAAMGLIWWFGQKQGSW